MNEDDRRDALTRFWDPSVRAWPVALAAGSAAFAIAAATISPTVATFDPAEFQTLARTGGIAHAGYPTLVLLLRLAGRLPFGTLAWRANLVSAVSGAVAVALLAYAGTRLVRRPALAAAAALAFALSLTMWKESTLAGVHTFTLAVDAALFLLALRFAHAPSARTAAATGLALGIGLTSHLTVLGLLPALLVVLARVARARALRAAHVAVALAALLAGLAPFGYTLACDRPGRPMNYLADTLDPSDGPIAVARPDIPHRLARLGWLLSGRQYFVNPGLRLGTLPVRIVQLAFDEGVNEFPFLALPLALAGLAIGLRRGGFVAAVALAWLAGTTAIAAYASSELTGRFFFLPGAWVLALGLAVALAAIAARASAAGAALAIAVLAAPFARLALDRPPPGVPARGPFVRTWREWPHEWSPFRRDTTYDAFGRGAMARLPRNAVVLAAGWDESQTLRYFVWGEPLRPDVDVRLAGPGGPRFRRMRDEARAAGRPVFATRRPADTDLAGGAAIPFYATRFAALWRLEPSRP